MFMPIDPTLLIPMGFKLMTIRIRTKVSQSLENVSNAFDESLFKQLSPPFPKVSVKQFDGSYEGAIVSVELDFLISKQSWISQITKSYASQNMFYFIDEGIKLPFFLKYWHHKHLVTDLGKEREITDEVTFKSWNLFTDLLLYPLLQVQFIYRKPIYKRIFG